MIQETTHLRKVSNAYNIFILVLTVLSLAVMVVILLPVLDATLQLLSIYDNLICFIFLIDFLLNLRGQPRNPIISSRNAAGLTCSAHSPLWGC